MSATQDCAAIDHLVIAAHDLNAGAAYIENLLGVELAPGGEHPQFGTHNRLLSLGSVYLEVIAVNRSAPEPTRPRWFGLGTGHSGRTKLIHWVARTPVTPLPVQGEPLALARGNYAWTLTVPEDGCLPLGGVLPSLIEWQGDTPAAALPNVAVRLRRLELFTPQPGELQAALTELKLLELVNIRRASEIRLRAVLDTPNGEVILD